MKKVMIVGAGIGQVNLLKICQERGYDVFVVSIPGDYPCFKLTNNIRYADILNKEAVLKIAQEEKIDAVISDQNDMAVSTVAYVAEKMGLRGIGYETALKFTNKYLMRKAAEEAGVAVPEYYQANTVEEAEEASKIIGFPLIMKPVDGWSGKGIFQINSVEEVRKNFSLSKQNSIVGNVIIEKYISGTSFMVNGFGENCTYLNTDWATKDSFKDFNVFVTKKVLIRSCKNIESELTQRVLNENYKLVKSLKLQIGITHADYIYNYEDDKIYLVEIAARGGGDTISSTLSPYASGVDTNNYLVDYVVEGIQHDLEKNKLKNNVCGYICFTIDSGVVSRIDGMDYLQNDKRIELSNLKHLKIGSIIKPAKVNRMGPIFFFAKTVEEAYEINDKIKNNLIIEVNNTKKSEIIW